MAISSRHKQRPGEWRDVLANEVLDQYVGRHIAVIHKKVVAAGDTYEQVRTAAEALYPNEMPYLAYIPDESFIEEQPATNIRPRKQRSSATASKTVEVNEEAA
jgi:hypothetical protein